jgi:hypothetical protein
VRSVEFHCDNCRGTRVFEQPLCQDGHGVDCPEWYCTACGDAVLISSFEVRLERQRTVRASNRAA